MKIISGHDYYDGAGYGVDETVIFVRKPKEFPDASSHPFRLPAPLHGRFGYARSLSYFRVLIGGLVFPGLRETVPGRQFWASGVTTFHYDPAAARGALERFRAEEGLNFFSRKPAHEIEEHFRQTARADWTEWMISHRAVTGLVTRTGRSARESGTRVDINVADLKEVEAFRALDPHSTHMQIANFISGVLPSSVETVEIGNADRIRKAGFDAGSFRMPKGTKKPRRRKG